MSYEPTEWKAGDVVTSAKLNKIEQGIKNSGNYVAQSEEELMNMTWQDIFNIEAEGRTIIYKNHDEETNIKTIYLFNHPYGLILSVSGSEDRIVFGSTPDSTIADMFNGDTLDAAIYKFFGLTVTNGELKAPTNTSMNPKILQQLMTLGYIPIIMWAKGNGTYLSHIKFISNDQTKIITEDGIEYRAETNNDPYILQETQDQS